MSNYPPGVTGHELEIAGPDREMVLERECDYCEFTGDMDCYEYRGVITCTCPECGMDTEEDADV